MPRGSRPRGADPASGLHRQREQEPRAFGVARVQPDPPAKVLDDLPAHGQADAGTRVSAPLVQALEDHEDPFGVLGLDPHAVVAEREQPERLVPGTGDHDPRRLAAAELQRVAEQVLEHRGEQRQLGQHQRQVPESLPWRRSPPSPWPGCSWPGPARRRWRPERARARTGPPGCTGAGR